MKRDWDVIRKILFKLEEIGNTTSTLESNQVNGCDSELVSYHMQLLDEAELIKARCIKSMGSPLQCVALSMTWKGHEFLDQFRQDTVWNKVKSTVREKGLDLSIDVIKLSAKRVIESVLNPG